MAQSHPRSVSVDITLEFWDFVRDVAGNPDVMGDELKELPTFAAISTLFCVGDAVPCGAVKFTMRAGATSVPPPDATTSASASASPWMLRDGGVWDAAGSMYVFDNVESTFYGVCEILSSGSVSGGSVSGVSEAVRLHQVRACLSKIDRWLSVASLAGDVERGLNVADR